MDNEVTEIISLEEANRTTLNACIILELLNNPKASLSEITQNVKNEGFDDITEEFVKMVLKAEFGSLGALGDEIEFYGEEFAKVQMSKVVESQVKYFSIIFEGYKIAVDKFNDGEISGVELAAISKEVRLWQELMIKIINNAFDPKSSGPNTLVHVNTVTPEDIFNSIKNAGNDGGAVYEHKKDS